MKTRKSKVITLRVTDEEKKLLELKARRTRKTLSAYILSKTIKDNKKSTSAAKTDSVKKITLPKVDPKKVIQLNEGVNYKKETKKNK